MTKTFNEKTVRLIEPFFFPIYQIELGKPAWPHECIHFLK